MIGIAYFKIQNNNKKLMSTLADGSLIQALILKIKTVKLLHMLEYRQFMIYSALILEMLIKLWNLLFLRLFQADRNNSQIIFMLKFFHLLFHIKHLVLKFPKLFLILKINSHNKENLMMLSSKPKFSTCIKI